MSCACTSKTTVRRGVGTKFTTVRRIGRVTQTTIQEITQADPPTGWAAVASTDRFGQTPPLPSSRSPTAPDPWSRSLLNFEGHGIGKLLPLEVSAAWRPRARPEVTRTRLNYSNAAPNETRPPRTPRDSKTSIAAHGAASANTKVDRLQDSDPGSGL
jgi:hypothetical protein